MLASRSGLEALSQSFTPRRGREQDKTLDGSIKEKRKTQEMKTEIW